MDPFTDIQEAWFDPQQEVFLVWLDNFIHTGGTVEKDNDGQFIIYTGVYEDGNAN